MVMPNTFLTQRRRPFLAQEELLPLLQQVQSYHRNQSGAQQLYQQNMAEQARGEADYRRRVAEDKVGIEPYSLFLGRQTEDPSAGFEFAPADLWPGSAVVKKGLLATAAAIPSLMYWNYARKNPVPSGMLGGPAFHGTPHKWESGVPDLSKVGTGEGAQAYGHGIYFAEKEGVAKSYLPNEEDASFLLDGKKVDTPWTSEIRERWPDLYSGLSEERAEVLDVVLANIGQVSAEGDLIHVLNNFNGPERQIYSTLIEKKLVHSGVPTGNLYKVDIPDAEIDRMLDYDAPLKNQNDLVKEMLRDVLKEMKFLGPNDNGPRQLTSAWKAARMQYADMNDGDTGAAIYRVLGSRNTSSVEYLSRDPSLPSVDPRKLASEYLASKGIPGIKYLDQGSRDANKGTRNFVVFDEELLNKLKVGEAE